MRRGVWATGAGLLLCLLLGGCVSGSTTSTAPATVLVSYDAAVAAEQVYLASTKVTAAEATKLRALRVTAWTAVSAYETAAAAGDSAAATLLVTASATVAALLAEANTAQGT